MRVSPPAFAPAFALGIAGAFAFAISAFAFAISAFAFAI